MNFKNWLYEAQVATQQHIVHPVASTGQMAATMPGVMAGNVMQKAGSSIDSAIGIISQFIDPRYQHRNAFNPSQALSGAAGTPGYVAPEVAARAFKPQHTNNTDLVEDLIAGLANSVPFQKERLDKVAKSWRDFRDSVYQKAWGENWWGSRPGPPNPALYDVDIMRADRLEEPLRLLQRVFQSPTPDAARHAALFNTFLRDYQSVIPGVVATVKNFRKNTKRF